MSETFELGAAFFMPLAGALFITCWLYRLLLWVFRMFGLDRI